MRACTNSCFLNQTHAHHILELHESIYKSCVVHRLTSTYGETLLILASYFFFFKSTYGEVYLNRAYIS